MADLSLVLFTGLIVAVGFERLAELVIARRNAQWSFARGGHEFGALHYRVMVVLHTGLLVGCLVEVWTRRPDFVPALGWTMLGLALAAQVLRWWCIAALGRQWNTRVIIVPGLPLVTRGPYRYRLLRHPNYIAVVIEGFALPLVHSAWIAAVIFTVANAALMTVRIRTENRALQSLGAPGANASNP